MVKRERDLSIDLEGDEEKEELIFEIANDSIWSTVRRQKSKPVTFSRIIKSRRVDEDYIPENEEDDIEENIEMIPEEGSREEAFLNNLLENAKNKGHEMEDPKQLSILLEDTEEAKELIRNTAINSFKYDEKKTEKSISEKEKLIKKRESDHIKTTSIQNVLRSLFGQVGGAFDVLSSMGDDEEDEDDEDFSNDIENKISHENIQDEEDEGEFEDL